MGREGVIAIISGAANGPISVRTSSRNSFTSSSSSSVFDSVRVAKAMIASPRKIMGLNEKEQVFLVSCMDMEIPNII